MISLQEYITHLPSQNNIGCCSASATLLCMEMLLTMDGKYVFLSRLFTYYMARKIKGRLGKKGIDLGSTFESLLLHGAIPEELWPFSNHRVEIEPNNKVIDDSARCRIRSYRYIHPNDINNMIDNKTPVAIGFRTGRQFWKLNGKMNDLDYRPVNLTDNRESTGHAAVVIGYDTNNWIIANSLGPKWGDHGIGIFPFECAVDIGEAYSITGIRHLG